MDHGVAATQAFASAMYHLGKVVSTRERKSLVYAFEARLAVAQDRVRQDEFVAEKKVVKE